jgi:hypothetical protein
MAKNISRVIKLIVFTSLLAQASQAECPSSLINNGCTKCTSGKVTLCSECKPGFYLKKNKLSCFECKSIENCDYCEHFKGCSQCSEGYVSYTDNESELTKCSSSKFVEIWLKILLFSFLFICTFCLIAMIKCCCNCQTKNKMDLDESVDSYQDTVSSGNGRLTLNSMNSEGSTLTNNFFT